MTQTEPREWQDFTQKAMDLAGVNQVEMARLLSLKLGYKVHQSSVQSRVAGPNGRAPREQVELDAWADALKLDGQHRERFMRLSLLERTPPDIRARLFALEQDLEKAQRKLKGEQTRANELRATIDRLTAELAKVTAQATDLVQRLERR